MTEKPPETLDLSLREGIVTYIETILCADIRKAFEMTNGLQPYGVALGTMQNGIELPRPQPMAVGAYGMGVRNTKRNLRTLAKNTKATGTILVRVTTVEKKGSTRQDELVLVQLEHKEFGDIVWTAPVVAGKLGDFTEATALADAAHTIATTKLLPNRWMH